MPRLRDILPARPRLLLVGINPSLRSAALGHHFAGPGNPFWRLLYAARLTPEPLTPALDHRLATWGIGLTNLCPRPTRAASELTADEMRAGARRLRRLCRAVDPRLVAFVGVSLYQTFFALPKSGGPGPKKEKIGQAAVFVVPNPSGLNASFPGFADKLIWYQRLYDAVTQLETHPDRQPLAGGQDGGPELVAAGQSLVEGPHGRKRRGGRGA